ncbi:hypothetical protein HNR21_002238 [Actinomadura cellulosilytica]|uniref:HNH endonuclease n=1 Tax=Thermomonospora cellulosilytica TaxID=1411118 RepID=A0A7W3MWV2_9ACTN|nr:hypothetical protein [Thermomonospora cellulosilytica]
MATIYREHPCDYCGTPTRNRRFCSHPCALKGTQEQRAASLRKPKSPCPQCGCPIRSRGAKHCSRECAIKARTTRPAPCRRCGSEERTGRRRTGPYCSWSCWNEDRYERTGSCASWVRSWLSGEISGTTEKGRPDHRVKHALVSLRGRRCEQCGWDKVNPVSGRVPLHLDHITGDRKRNRPEEVRLLCPNCHALTPTYQHLNNSRVSATRKHPSRRHLETWMTDQPTARITYPLMAPVKDCYLVVARRSQPD